MANKLADFFEVVAYKSLVLVDLPNRGSHQHELNGSRALGAVLGWNKIKGTISWRRFSDINNIESEDGSFTWYDARERSSARTGRTEWRFYYTGDFLSKARVEDTLVVAKKKSGEIFGLVFEKDSNWFKAAADLFGVKSTQGNALLVLDKEDLLNREIPSQGNPLVESLRLRRPAQQTQASEPPLRKEPLESGKFKFRPASRLIATIGQNLIKDPPAALIELVKNAYDADSSEVTIQIQRCFARNFGPSVRFLVTDNGHGMTYDTVTGKWLVPATDYKAKNRYSPKGRRMQGNKGIGRYASFLLGNELLLRTTSNHRETSVLLDWNDFERHEFLDEVQVLVEERTTDLPAGTIFEINGGSDYLSRWDKTSFDVLLNELRKLLSPFQIEEDPFSIHLQVQGFESPYENFAERIEPFSLTDLFDYRLTGKVTEDGLATFIYENQVIGGKESRELEFRVPISEERQCGPIEIDFRVFDRDPKAIDELISRGLRNLTGVLAGRREAKELLDESVGVSIFRGDFKIRPYGDAGYDWLELDKQRVQNPSLRIGSDQIIGLIRIGPEEVSHLIEKSARDGLKDDGAFCTLKKIAQSALAQLEERRFAFRRKISRGRKTVKVGQVVNQLIDLGATAEKIEHLLADSKVDKSRIAQVKTILEETNREKLDLIEKIQETIAIYQGQATLGKIIMVLLHEGRKPVGYFRDMAPMILEWIDRLNTDPNARLLSKISDRLKNVHDQAQLLTALFDRLEPLSIRKRHKAKMFSVIVPIQKSQDVFHNELEANEIKCDVSTDLQATRVTGWEEDFLLIFTNLFENSVYWLRESPPQSPRIKIFVQNSDAGPIVFFEDNGPGVAEELIRDDLLFEPGFSTKKQGTGLGLAIAGEAAERNGCKLKAHFSTEGAKFALELFPGLQVEKERP